MPRGKLIVLYGINNLGKTLQAKRLVDRLQQEGLVTAYLKYGLYDLEPSGPVLNAYLREGNPHGLAAREFQLVHVLNRTQYDMELRNRLEQGEWIVAEDYVGTGIAWGVGAGVDMDFLEKMNSHLLREDLGILFQGKRFMQAQEQGHTHETNDELTEKVRVTHEILGQKYNWVPVQANQTIEEVSEAVWQIVSSRLL